VNSDRVRLFVTEY